jgi:hypothetical protein
MRCNSIVSSAILVRNIDFQEVLRDFPHFIFEISSVIICKRHRPPTSKRMTAHNSFWISIEDKIRPVGPCGFFDPKGHVSIPDTPILVPILSKVNLIHFSLSYIVWCILMLQASRWVGVTCCILRPPHPPSIQWRAREIKLLIIQNYPANYALSSQIFSSTSFHSTLNICFFVHQCNIHFLLFRRPQRQHKYSNTRTLTISTLSAEAHGWHPDVGKEIGITEHQLLESIL